MKRFDVVAINQSAIIVIFSTSFFVLIGAVIFLLATGYMTIFSFIVVMVISCSLLILLRRYFVYSLTLELYSDRIKLFKMNQEVEILLTDIESYKVENMDGIRLDLNLRSSKRIRIVTSNNFGSNPDVLEDFYKHFIEKVGLIQKELSTVIERRKSFLETRLGFVSVVISAIIATAGILYSILIKGNINLATIFVIVTPFVILIPYMIKVRNG